MRPIQAKPNQPPKVAIQEGPGRSSSSTDPLLCKKKVKALDDARQEGREAPDKAARGQDKTSSSSHRKPLGKVLVIALVAARRVDVAREQAVRDVQRPFLRLDPHPLGPVVRVGGHLILQEAKWGVSGNGQGFRFATCRAFMFGVLSDYIR